MHLSKVSAAFLATTAMGLSANAQTVVEGFEINTTGVIGGLAGDVTNATVNGVANNPANPAVAADPITVAFTLSNQDFDGDGTANDSVDITLTATSTNAGTLRLFNQGFDSGFGSLNNVQVTATATGNTTDNGDVISFDGFTGAGLGAGGGGAVSVDRSAEVNGTLISLSTTANGDFQFTQDSIDFGAPAASVLFTNSGGTAGSLVARSYDMQFSTTPIPEPASLALLGLGGVALLGRRSK